MKINSIVITIDEFDNAAMVDNPGGEVARILGELSRTIREYGVQHCDGRRLLDSSGNSVGNVAVEFCEDDEEESEDDNET